MEFHFEGRLTARDAKRHIPHELTVPANCGQIDIHFRFSPPRAYDIPNLLTLTLFDPVGFRGARHRDGDEHRVRLTATEAIPGYLSGPLRMGTWIVEVDTHMIMPGEPVRYLLDISVEEGTDERGSNRTARIETAAQPMGRRRAERGAGWYRGDLHCHTHHSDGEGFTVTQLVEAARNAELDFVFLTDHNTTAGLAEMERLSSEDLLTAGGIELTTFWGHALCLGTREWVDWRTRPNTGDIARLAATVYANEQVFIIAHPQSTGDPACTGCAWRYGDMMPGAAQLVEVWNGPWKGDSNNEQALALWYDWLNEGLGLVGTAGTDAHGGRDYAARPGFNVVFADALSEAALLMALRAGHLYLSGGPQVTFQARNTRGERWFIGDTAMPPVTLTVTWADCPAGGQLRVVLSEIVDNSKASGPTYPCRPPHLTLRVSCISLLLSAHVARGGARIPHATSPFCLARTGLAYPARPRSLAPAVSSLEAEAPGCPTDPGQATTPAPPAHPGRLSRLS